MSLNVVDTVKQTLRRYYINLESVSCICINCYYEELQVVTLSIVVTVLTCNVPYKGECQIHQLLLQSNFKSYKLLVQPLREYPVHPV